MFTRIIVHRASQVSSNSAEAQDSKGNESCVNSAEPLGNLEGLARTHREERLGDIAAEPARVGDGEGMTRDRLTTTYCSAQQRQRC